MFKVQPYSQMDPRWKDDSLGLDNSTTIGKFGCLLTCMAMVADGFGNDVTPQSLNEKMKVAGGFQGALVMPAVLPNVLPGVRYHKYIQCKNPPAPIADIDATLDAGLPVIVEVDYSPAPGMQNHWIVLYDRQGDDYLIQDPWPYPVKSKKNTLTSRYGFAGAPRMIIKGAIWLSGVQESQTATPKVKPTPKPLPKDAITVYSTADGLALRAQPYVADNNLITRVPLQAEFKVLEPPAQAAGKIGQVNQWLEVQAVPAGDQGYVAAWYVAESKDTVPEVGTPVAPAPQPVPAGQSLVVYATADGLALRSQPMVADTTLIKREPQNAEFVVLDPPDQAKAKIGVQDQWLQARDIAGDQGYVAAWYVDTSRQEPALGAFEKSATAPSPTASPSADKLVVRSTADGLALRSQPVISDATLIKREPLSAELLVLEPVNQAEAKIGVVNRWLNVQDVSGDKGYVAAWYVVKNPTPSAA
jgi:hypothetical protein